MEHMHRSHSKAVLAGMVAVLLGAPIVAFASTGLSIQPVKIDQTLSPGQSTSGTITLTNVSDTPVNVAVSTQDFVPLAGADTIQFVGRAPGVTSVRDWIQVGDGASFTIALNETKEIPYTITAPADAEPGSHFGVVLFNATTKSAGQSLNIGTQVGMLVLVTVPGNHLENGKILDFSTNAFMQTGPVPFSLRFENTGTVYFEPQGTITIYDMLGRQVGTVPIQGEVVLPTSIRDMEFDWDVSGFLFGRYSAVATIVDGSGTTLTTAQTTFWVLPVWYIVGFLVLLIVLFFLIRFIKRRVKFSVSVN
jgi:hypothetical protein